MPMRSKGTLTEKAMTFTMVRCAARTLVLASFHSHWWAWCQHGNPSLWFYSSHLSWLTTYKFICTLQGQYTWSDTIQNHIYFIFIADTCIISLVVIPSHCPVCLYICWATNYVGISVVLITDTKLQNNTFSFSLINYCWSPSVTKTLQQIISYNKINCNFLA